MCSERYAADAALALGGLRMKLVKFFCMVALLAISAAAVKAGTIGGDPKFNIQNPGGIASLDCIGTCPGDEMVVLEYTGHTMTFTSLHPFDIFILPGSVPGGWVPSSD